MHGLLVRADRDEGESIFVVLAGQAKVTVKGRTVGRTLPGDHFGEISLLDGGPRTASVVSETPMTMLMITRKDFQKVLNDDPEVAIALMANIARMIHAPSPGEAR